MLTKAASEKLEAAIDETLADTFPASDPPAWTLGREPSAMTQESVDIVQPLENATVNITYSEEHTPTFHILGIVGSLRRESYNRAALRAAQQLVPTNTTLEICDLVGIPPYNQDDEQHPPTAVIEFKNRIRAADAILIATPEYNYSIPGVLKNAIDWASRPVGDSAWGGKTVALLGASVGRVGTARAQYHLRQMFVTLDMYPVNRPEVMIGNAAEVFDREGKLSDAKTLAAIKRLIEQLVQWTHRLQRSYSRGKQ